MFQRSCLRRKKNDIVYILGDIAHRIPVEDANQMIERLNGKNPGVVPFICMDIFIAKGITICNRKGMKY